MTLHPTEANIEWLLEKLWEANRTLENCGETQNPVFVLLTRGKDMRQALEEKFIHYVAKKYGIDYLSSYTRHHDAHQSLICLHGIKITLLDLP